MASEGLSEGAGASESEATASAAPRAASTPTAIVEGAIHESGRTEVSATTVGRMLGLATINEIKLLETKIDLISTRVHNLTVRMEKVMTAVTAAPTGGDLERIDVQIASLRTLIKESMAAITSGMPAETAAEGAGRKRLSASIRASTKPAEESGSSEE